MTTEVLDETVKRLSSQLGVIGVIVVNADGIPIRSTLQPHSLAIQYAALGLKLAHAARRAVKQLSHASYNAASDSLEKKSSAADAKMDDLEFLRIRSKKHEILIAPDFEGTRELTLVVVQQPCAN